MSKIDFTKPIRTTVDHLPRTYIGRDGEFYVIKREDGTYYCVDDFGYYRGNERTSHYGPFIENAPVTHERWLVVYKIAGGNDNGSVVTFVEEPTKDHLSVFQQILAIKKVVIEEGEGLT